MPYTVGRGDTLTAIAKRYHTTVAKLLKANPKLKNSNRIAIGQHLNIPGQSDAFEHGAAHGPSLNPEPPQHAGANAADVARQFLGQNIATIKARGSLGKDLDKWPPNNVCCANFVSACLQKAGQLPASLHSDSVPGLSHNLSKDPHFKKVSLAHAKPGDVVCFDVPGEGHFAHAEIYAGKDASGRPKFIGSNNVNADGTQRITEGHVRYGIDAIYQYVG